MKEDKPTYREQFVTPEMSILAFLLQKVHVYMTLNSVLHYVIILA